jgi:uncharacterized damage-inducible protein DinB
MQAADLIRRLHQHRDWANRNLLAAAAILTDEQRKAVFAIGQGSLWKTLLHLFAAEYVWLECLLGNDSATTPGDLPNKIPGNQEGSPRIESLDELTTKWNELAQRWNRYLGRLTDASLDEIVYRVSTSSGFGKRHPGRRADILLHVCTHAQYTVAQVMNMLRQSGVTVYPDVMLITLSRQEAGTLTP